MYSRARQVERPRRTRIAPGTVESLTPLEALRLYLESRDTRADRKKKLLEYAERLIAVEKEDQA